MTFGLFVCFFLGVMMLIKPELFSKIEHIFSVKDGEPTGLYLALMRISSLLLLL
ncbi:MAG: DUF6199 family natural product biosynthesis protein [Candidatus Fimimorpha sp.]